jgi:hypothetical protein
MDKYIALISHDGKKPDMVSLVLKNIELLNPEDIRRPNGSIGTQGFAPEQMKDLVSYLSDLLNLNIPSDLMDKSKEELKPLIDYIKNDKNIVDKIIEYVKTNPSEVSYLPDGTIQFEDGNHRANLLNIIGADVIPVIKQSKLNEINAKYDPELQALESKQTPLPTTEESKQESLPINENVDTFEKTFSNNIKEPSIKN